MQVSSGCRKAGWNTCYHFCSACMEQWSIAQQVSWLTQGHRRAAQPLPPKSFLITAHTSMLFLTAGKAHLLHSSWYTLPGTGPSRSTYVLVSVILLQTLQFAGEYIKGNVLLTASETTRIEMPLHSLVTSVADPYKLSQLNAHSFQLRDVTSASIFFHSIGLIYKTALHNF